MIKNTKMTVLFCAAATVLFTAPLQAETRHGKESGKYAEGQRLNWTELENELNSVMENAVDQAVTQALRDAAEEYERKVQKEREKKQFWKHIAVTQTVVIATGFFTGIAVYRMVR